ncbi:hypothetical protein BJX61DRAFT_184701 [Aspergillus egyptiacus]|nr:hypothetical protein BJX61DRAFT_184701 [Aspergillus egyptiacus]
MRTNLSRFSVSFSDLSWETVFEGETVPMFPRAWQVRRYLERYARMYIPDGCLRLGCRIIRASQCLDGVGLANEGGGRWEVEWTCESKPDTVKERFDYLVVASGHFATPNIPDLPGFKDFPNTVHSSSLQSPEDIDGLLEKSTQGGILVVVGGSMSGVEAATSLATHLSSSKFQPGSFERAGKEYEVWHISTSPFWVLPTYLPHRYSNDPSKARTMPFLPLDLYLYDIDRRPPGDFAFGPKTPQQIFGINQSFRALLGEDYSGFGGVNVTHDPVIDGDGRGSKRPPWVAISDSYAEFIRSGDIHIKTGRACSVDVRPSGHATIAIQTEDGLKSTLNGVAAVVMATGFNPSTSLSFLDKEILSTLEYSENDHFLPLILDSWSSSHSEIPDLGFVGFYRGAFWGPAELQAQNLARRWGSMKLEDRSLDAEAEELEKRAKQRQAVRDFRNTQTTVRGQFPLGDYVGLMESLARTNGLTRVSMDMDAGDTQPSGPVVPARYLPPDSRDHDERGRYPPQKESVRSMRSLRSILFAESAQARTGTAAAIFRALHGHWKAHKETTDGSLKSGEAAFHPRYPSSPNYEREYLCEEVIDGKETRLIYHLVQYTASSAQNTQIHIWSVRQAHPNSAAELLQELQFEPAGEVTASGLFLIRAEDCGQRQRKTKYEFYLDGVAIRDWYCAVVSCDQDGNEVGTCRTWYSRRPTRFRGKEDGSYRVA